MFDQRLGGGVEETEHGEVLFGLFVVADAVVKESSLEVVGADFGLYFDELVVADDAVDVVAQVVVALGFEE